MVRLISYSAVLVLVLGIICSVPVMAGIEFPYVLNTDKILAEVTKSQKRNKPGTLKQMPFEATTSTLVKGPAYLLKPDSIEQPLSIWTKKDRKAWYTAKYLTMEVVNPNAYMVNVYIHFYQDRDSKTKIRQCGASIGLLPGVPTKLVLPLSYLDCQQIYLPRYPRQMKGRIMGSAISQDKISDVMLTVDPYRKRDFESKLVLGKIELQQELNTQMPALAAPYIDELFQAANKTWPQKQQGTFEHAYYLKQLDTLYQQAQYPVGWTASGGLNLLKTEGTGWFRVEKVKERWWFITPEGHAFLSNGVDCVRPSSDAVIEGYEELYQKLPTLFDTVRYFRNRQGQKSLNVLGENWLRARGKNWKTDWQRLTLNMMRTWRFNTIGNWSDTGFIRYSKMPYVYPLANFPRTQKLVYRDFPDVFDPSYTDSARKFAQQLKPLADDRNMIGYFLRNEPEWAFGDNNLALEMLRSPSRKTYTRRELRDWLINRYRGNIKAMSTAWGVKLKSFEQLDTTVFASTVQFSDSAQRELKSFSYQMVDQYLKPVCKAVKEVDPHHLNLGIRYAWISSDLCYHAGEYFDVFSVNGYNSPGPPPTAEITKRTGRPVLIGEFHFGATDQGLPSTGICGVSTQTDRGIAYQYYVEQGFARPEVIGIHYFQWNDQPLGGRFDGENYNIGLVDICNMPYNDFVGRARDANTRMYEVARKFYPPANKKAKYAPAIF